jgi:hypothetical protein
VALREGGLVLEIDTDEDLDLKRAEEVHVVVQGGRLFRI